MNQNHEHPHDEVRELLAEAGSPPPIPAAELAGIRRAAREEWRARHTGPAKRSGNSRSWLAIAAGLLLAVTLAWWSMGRLPSGSAEVVATVALVRGDASVTPAASDEARSPIAGDELTTGSTVQTSTGRLAIASPGGPSIRFDAGTEASIVSATRVELRHGAVYVDSGPGHASNVEIATPLGLVTEIGTQFEVRVGNGNGETVRVRVREGSVSLAHNGESYAASIGQQLTIDSRGEVFRASVAVRGREWAWAVEAAPSMNIDGRSVLAYLDWIARETGWEIQYTDAGLEQGAAENFINGSIEGLGLTPEQSLEVVLPGSDLGYELRDGILLIGN